MRNWKGSLFVFLMAAMLLTACGEKSDSSAPEDTAAASQDLVIKASNWQFDQQEYTIPKDTAVRFKLDNEQGAHGVVISGTDVKLSNGTKSKVATLKEGTYTIKCYITCGEGHLRMNAKLIVK